MVNGSQRNSAIIQAIENMKIYKKVNENLLKSEEEELFCKEYSNNFKKILVTSAIFVISITVIIIRSLFNFNFARDYNQVIGYVRDNGVFYITDKKNTVSLRELNLEDENLQDGCEIIIYLDNENNIVKSYSQKSRQNSSSTMSFFITSVSGVVVVILTRLFVNENRIRKNYYKTVIEPWLEKIYKNKIT